MRWDDSARIWRIAGPIILANLSTPLLGAVDTAVVGHLPDPANIGAVAIGAVIFSFLYWGFGFLRMGTTGFTAQAHGARDLVELKAALLRPLVVALALGCCLIVLQRPIGLLALGLMEGSRDVDALARAYFDLRIWSAPAALVNYCVIGWLLGIQRAGVTLMLQLLLNGSNIALDLLFVVGFGWGVEGVAAATLLAELGTAVTGLCLVFGIARRLGGRFDLERTFARHAMVRLLRVNIDIFLRTLSLITAFAIFTSRGAAMGDIVLAGNAILLQFQSFIAYGLDGFAHAAEVIAGSAYGARRRRDFRRAVVVSTVWALASACLMSLAVAGGGHAIVALFTDIEPVREAARQYLVWLVISPLVSVWSFQLDGIFIGATRTAAMRNAMLVSLAAFLVGVYTLPAAFGNDGLWLTMMLFMAVRALTLGIAYPALENSLEPTKGSSDGLEVGKQ